VGRGIAPDPIAQIKDDKVGHPGTTRSLRKPRDFVWRLTNDSLGRGSPRDGFNPFGAIRSYLLPQVPTIG